MRVLAVPRSANRWSTIAAGIVNLDAGGTLTTPLVAFVDSGIAAFDFNGGTLIAGRSNAAFMDGLAAANVKAARARIDSGGHNVTVAQPLLDGGGSGALPSPASRGRGAHQITSQRPPPSARLAAPAPRRTGVR